MKTKKTLVNILFFIHTIIVLGIYGMFLIPSSIWPGVIEFHFFYILVIFLLYFIWGAIWTFKLRDRIYAICFLSTLMQYFRGYSFFDPKNYNYSFTAEFFSKLSIKLNEKKVTFWMFVLLLVAAILFVLKLNGIVFY
ncbi:MAG TPA: hypothetical protein VJI68_02920 [Candidatus Nanoarchaeia archaeon]|nr:hypothetical protein [Candidatus Nanoarchaeia archaeon]